MNEVFKDDKLDEFLYSCINEYIDKNLRSLGYFDIKNISERLLLKGEKSDIAKFSNTSDKIKKLYKEKYPEDTKSLENCLSNFFNESNYNELSLYDLQLIITYMDRAIDEINKSINKYNRNNKTNSIPPLPDVKNRIDKFHVKDNLSIDCNIVFNSNDVCVDFISDVNSLLSKLSNSSSFYFRGQSKTMYTLQPSVFRNDSFKKNENRMYNDMLINCPDDFKFMHRHIDYLVKMQHYGLYTRLLDITSNPIVALYFACNNDSSDNGEFIIFNIPDENIQYETSDSITMLSCLPLFSNEEQKELLECAKSGDISKNKNTQLAFEHELQKEKNITLNEVNIKNLKNSYAVLTQKSNDRIIRQSGAFIICGLDDNPHEIITENFRLKKDNKPQYFFITSDAKEDILKELDSLSINKATLFPEIENVAQYIKEKYNAKMEDATL